MGGGEANERKTEKTVKADGAMGGRGTGGLLQENSADVQQQPFALPLVHWGMERCEKSQISPLRPAWKITSKRTSVLL